MYAYSFAGFGQMQQVETPPTISLDVTNCIRETQVMRERGMPVPANYCNPDQIAARKAVGVRTEPLRREPIRPSPVAPVSLPMMMMAPERPNVWPLVIGGAVLAFVFFGRRRR